MHMPRVLSFSLLLCWLAVLPALARPQVPEGPTGVAICSDQSDNDLDGSIDGSDATCATAHAFSAQGTGYAALATNFVKAGGWTTVADATAPCGGNYATLPLGTDPAGAEMRSGGVPAGTYRVWALVAFDAAESSRLWLKAGTTGFGGNPSNADGSLLNSGQPLPSWGWIPLGRFDSPSLWRLGVEGTPQRTVTIASGDVVTVAGLAGLKIAALYVDTSASATPACPGGGGGGTPGTIEYTLKEIGANTPVIDGTLDTFAMTANAISYQGVNTGNTGTCTTRLAWDDSTNRIYGWHQCQVTGLIDNGTGGVEDSGNVVFGSGLRVNLRLVDQMRVRDASTYLFAVNTLASTYDRNELNGSPNAAYDFAAKLVGVTYAANVLTIEFYIQPDEDLVAGQLLLLEVSAHELRSGVPQTSQYAKCLTVATSDPSCWMVATLSATTMVGAPDTTGPTVGTPSCTPNSSGAVCTATSSEPGTCQAFRDADNDGEVIGDADFVTTSCGDVLAGVCTCTFTGLTLPNHEVIIQARDASGNTTNSAITDFTLTAAGPSLYISPTGSDAGANTCTNSGSPCKTFAYTLPKLDPGETLILQDGTYTSGTTGLLTVDCAAAGLKQGTPSARILVKAENERKARINGTVAGLNTAKLHNCSYWGFQGIVFAKQRFDSDGTNSTATNVDIKESPNWLLSRNVFMGMAGGVTSCPAHRNGSLTLRDNSNFGLAEENEIYSFSRDGFNIKHNQGNTFRRNYANVRGAGECTTGSGRTIFLNYPGGNQLWENNIAEGASAGNGKAYGCSSYSRSGGITNTCTGNRYLGLMALTSKLGLQLAVATNEGAGSAPLNNTIKHFLMVGSPSVPATGLISKDSENTVAENISTLNVNGGGIATATTSIAGSSVNNTFTGRNLLILNSAAAGLSIASGTDDWSVTSIRAFGNSPNFSGSAAPSCTNCSSVVTTDPNIGSCKVYTGLTTGAEILYRYQDGVLTTTKLWTATPPTGYTGTSYPFYFPCGAVTAEAENTDPANSCAGAANRLSVTSACVPGGY